MKFNLESILHKRLGLQSWSRELVGRPLPTQHTGSSHQKWKNLSIQRWTGSQNVRALSSASDNSYYGQRMFGAFHFGTSEYESCFKGLPHPNPDDFRSAGLTFLDEKFDAEQWFKDPICSIVNGKALPHETKPVETLDAMGQVNGLQVLASREQVETVLKPHICSFQSKWTDLRDQIRQAEQDILTHHGGALVGNQCMDFAKQDGATELEEAVMACVVERRLNDYLLLEEKRKHVTVNRKPIFVHCVSNFSNFLDLSRKVIRSLEVGVPVLILGRTNQVQQHSFRWTQLLIEQAIQKQGVDPGMITYLSCSLDDIKDILQTCQDHTGNLYMTGSRELAAQITSIYPNTIASTGGPNTMLLSTAKQADPIDSDPQDAVDVEAVKNMMNRKKLDSNPNTKAPATKSKIDEEEEEWFTAEMKAAIATSASIESAGQCTALRHVIVPPSFTEDDVEGIMASCAQTIDSPVEALRQKKCDGIFPNTDSKGPPESAGYKFDEKSHSYWKLNDKLPEPTTEEGKNGLPEYWRKVVVDYTKLETDPWDYATVDKLAHWLNQTQPISLAINGNMVDSYKNLRRLFDRTALAVYTVGGRNSDVIPTNPLPKLFPPALTCQARPQEGEIFGEVPPRNEMAKYTKFPVYVPSSNPSYDTTYQSDFLRQQSVGTTWIKSSANLVEEVQSEEIRGYCCLLVEYLRNVDVCNPKEVRLTDQARTVLWGIQRPPLQTTTIVRCGSDSATWDACAPISILFHASSARDQLQLSLPPGNSAMKSICDKHKLSYVVETEQELQHRVADNGGTGKDSLVVFQVARVDEPMSVFPMVGQFASLYFPMGHVKSTAPRDEEFIMRLTMSSKKWLRSLF